MRGSELDRPAPIDVRRARQSSPSLDAIPQSLEHETTAPISTGPRGPNHRELQALAEGRGGPLVLADRYLLTSRIGRGGMATVFAGRSLSLDRPVAVKVLDDERGHRDDGLARFIAEARTTARVRGRNVVEVLDFGTTSEGVVYLVMELLEGEDLRQILRRGGPLSWPQAQQLMLQICAGLSAIHSHGVVHRDLKPSNCFCVPSEQGVTVKLLDFGIATQAGPRERDEQRTTENGRVVGTPEYMSPEQALGNDLDCRSDIYTAGIILGELLTGRVPFEGRSATAVIAEQIYEPAPSLRELAGASLAIDPRVERLYAKMLAKRPSDRPESAAALAEMIAEIRPSSRRIWWPFAGAAALLTSLFG